MGIGRRFGAAILAIASMVSACAVDTDEEGATSVASPQTDTSKKPKFSTAWIEPSGLMVYARASQSIGGKEVTALVDGLHGRGVSTLVLAYTQHLGCFFYRSDIGFAYLEHSEAGSKAVVPKNAYCHYLAPGGDFLDQLLDAADTRGMNVYVGLGQTGDVYLLNDIDAWLRKKPLTTKIDDMNARLFQATTMSNTMADELVRKYSAKHRSFTGFYLAHEAHCLDVALNYYQPVVAKLQEIAPSKRILISPARPLEVCFNTQSLPDMIREAGIDDYAYQDAIGAGHVIDANGVGAYHYDRPGARDEGIKEWRSRWASLKTLHASTGTKLWANVEAWTMSGPSYGNPAPASYARVSKQMDAAWPSTDTLMLNEALLVLDLPSTGLVHTDPKRRAAAAAFTKDWDAKR